MEKSFLTPSEIYKITVETGMRKSLMNLKSLIVLGFLGGAFIGLGFLACVRVSSAFSGNGGFVLLMGSCVFPLGLICIVIGGGELLTGNMMTLATSFFSRRISITAFCKNLIIIGIMNLIGAVFVAYFMGHLTGLTEGSVLDTTVKAAQSKVNGSAFSAFVSAIGCNWIVGMAIWLSNASKDLSSKIGLLWFPIMAFVIIGFQHVVANMFIIPAAIFAGADISWLEFGKNIGIVFAGNFVGATVLVAGLYTAVYGRE